jgi:hypothetical protein
MKAFVSGFCVISIAVVLLFSMPCYAQVETQRFLTPEKTGWKINNTELTNYTGLTDIGFFAGSIWLCDNSGCYESDAANYKNRLISKYDGSWDFTLISYTVNGYIIPFLKFGKMTFCISNPGGSQCFDCKLTRDDNNFTYIP